MGRKKLAAPAPKAPAEPKVGAYQRFMDLGPEKLGALDTMLLKGDPIAKIVDVIQKDWNALTDVKEATLNKQLQRYREKYLIPRAKNFHDKVAAGVIGQDQHLTKAAKAMVERLNVMDHFEEILTIQRTRIMKVYKREESMPDGVVLDSLTKLLKDYQSGLTHYADLQMETGFLKRAPKTLLGQIGFGDDPSSRPVFEFALQEKRGEVEALADLSELLQNKVLEGECERVEPGS